MQIRKNKNDYHTYDIEIIDNGKVLIVSQMGMDINISCFYNDYCKIKSIDFFVSKNNKQLYDILNDLYLKIITGNIFGDDPTNLKVRRKIEEEKQTTWYKNHVKNQTIMVFDDAYSFSCPNILRITKYDDQIDLIFDKLEEKEHKNPYYISVQIRKSGSRLYEFCIPFFALFNQLQSLEEEIPMKRKK